MSVRELPEEQREQRIVHGDWQTPPELARYVCQFVHSSFDPDLVIEPNCGLGAFVEASLSEFSENVLVWGGDINQDYLDQISPDSRLVLCQADFFQGEWKKQIDSKDCSILLIGNPPWVTSAEISRYHSKNRPTCRNELGFSGLDAVTGKSNYDISQWMIQEEVKALQGKNACLAMLCKTSVARKIFEYVWNTKLKCSSFALYPFDAKSYFDVSVDAVLLVLTFNPLSDTEEQPGKVSRSIGEPDTIQTVWECYHHTLVNNAAIVQKYSGMIDVPQKFVWRSGVKHDCAKIMEFRLGDSGNLENGAGESVHIESEFLYPLLKSSDLANSKIDGTDRYILVTQKKVGQDTLFLKESAPETWEYLQKNSSFFEKRKSAVYRNSPPFSIFGVGDYSFKPWKVAISGLYKRLAFQIIGPICGKPVFFDDTCYFLSFDTRESAEFICQLLQTDLCREILSALIFWDAKRPITAGTLNRLNLKSAADYLGILGEYQRFFAEGSSEEQLLFSFV